MPSSYPNNLSEQFVAEKVPVGLPWRVLIFSFILFLTSLFIYFGFRFGYEPYLDDRVEVLDANLTELTRSVSLEDQGRLINFYSQLVNLKQVLNKHSFPSNIFTFLEKNTIAAVSFSEAELNIPQRTLYLEGLSRNLQSLAEQMTILERAPEVISVLTQKVNIVPNGVTFTIAIIFKPDFFSRPL